MHPVGLYCTVTFKFIIVHLVSLKYIKGSVLTCQLYFVILSAFYIHLLSSVPSVGLSVWFSYLVFQQFIQSITQHMLVISIKKLATCFGSLNHPQANFSKQSIGTVHSARAHAVGSHSVRTHLTNLTNE